MTAVSMNRTEIPLKSMPGGDGMRSCPTTVTDKSRYEMKSVIIPLRNTSTSANINIATNSNCGSATIRGTMMDQTTTNRQPFTASGHSYSSDSDVVPNAMTTTMTGSTTTTTTTSSATAMRRLYFKSAKLSKTTQNSITTVHQQQAQHVPKVEYFIMKNYYYCVHFIRN